MERKLTVGDRSAALRIAALVLLAVAIWFLAWAADAPPAPKPANAPVTEFSAARANAVLGRILGLEKPHPVSSGENGRVRARIQTEFAALGIPSRIYRGFGCERIARIGSIVCGTVNDVLAEVTPGRGKAIVLMAHYDSVPAGPGAADDASGVATILETVRALKVQPHSGLRPILALITDGEEAGLLGADAFLRDPTMRARIGAVVNVEARGDQGPSLLFQTSGGEQPLIDLYADNVTRYATSSLFSVIYRFLPNDTDLTPMLNAGLPGFNFAFVGNIAAYHTALDRRANLILASLQQHGDNMLGVVKGLEQADFAELHGGDEIYLSVLGRFLPRMPAAFALPLALACFALLLVAAWLSRGERLELSCWLTALAMPPALIFGSGIAGWFLHYLASLVSGQSDPSFAYPALFRVALSFGVLAAALACARMSELRHGSFAVWLWMAALAIVAAIFLPGLSPYFLFPLLVATPLLFVPLIRQWRGGLALVSVLLASLGAAVVWFGLSALGESVMGLALHPLFTIPVALAVIAALPLANAACLAKKNWMFAVTGAAALAVLFAVAAGLQPAFSKTAPQRLNIAFIDDHISNKSSWAVFTNAPLPQALRKAASFSASPDKVSSAPPREGYRAPIGITRYAPPSVIASIAPTRPGRKVLLTLQGSPVADRLFIAVPPQAGLRMVEIAGRRFDVSHDAAGTVIGCVSVDCRNKSLTLLFGSKRSADIIIGEQRFRLPPDAARLAAARPVWTTPSQDGDSTLVFKRLRLH